MILYATTATSAEIPKASGNAAATTTLEPISKIPGRPRHAMRVRNVESRLIKLEARRQRPNEILLIWRWPDADVKAATNGAMFAPGDRIISLEWFGDGPLPAPRWYRDRLTSEFGVTEKESLDSVGEDGRQRDPGFADIFNVPARRLCEVPDNDLMHMIFGIET